MPDSDSPQQPWDDYFRQHMRTRREALGLSQFELAKRVRAHGPGFHQQTVARIEDGERPVRLGEAYWIAVELGVEPDLFLDMVEAPDAERERLQRTLERLQVQRESVERELRQYLQLQDRLAWIADEMGDRLTFAENAVITQWLRSAPEVILAAARQRDPAVQQLVSDSLAELGITFPEPDPARPLTGFRKLLAEGRGEHGEHPEAP